MVAMRKTRCMLGEGTPRGGDKRIRARTIDLSNFCGKFWLSNCCVGHLPMKSLATPQSDIDSLVWKNLDADIYLAMHGASVRLFLDEVIIPSVAALNERIKEVESSDDEVTATFLTLDLIELRSSSLKAFALSIQALWERQFRGFLKGCAQELGKEDGYIEQLMRGEWNTLVRQFKELRGIPLSSFYSFNDLCLLQRLGNACRHGDGTSARKLYQTNPEFWLRRAVGPFGEGSRGQPEVANAAPPFSSALVPLAVVRRLALAVIWFWEDHNYIYINSIERKHRSIETTLTRMRADRARRDSVVALLADA